MNQQQKNYTLRRLDEILIRKLEPLKERFTTEEVSLTQAEKWALVISGEALARPEADVDFDAYDIRLEDVFDFSDLESDEKFDIEMYNTTVNKFTVECQKLKDEIMLGSADEAIDRISLFEALSI